MGILNDVTLTPSLNVLCANINCFNQTRPLFEKEKIRDNKRLILNVNKNKLS